MGDLLLIEDRCLVRGARVAESDPEHEAVELSLRQRECTLVFDWVLRGDHQERFRHLISGAVDGRLMLLHALQQRGLCLGRGPVDLVGENDLRHDRARPEFEFLSLLVVYRQAGHVGRKKVRRELDPSEGASKTSRHCFGEHRLAGSGHVFDEQMAAA